MTLIMLIKRLTPLLALTLLFTAIVSAQSSSASTDDPPPIEDNSFLIEEAYNQEPGVIQHINTLQINRNGEIGYTFTQEIPIASRRHQFSYTLPAARINASDGKRQSGIGDIALNYRFQLTDTERVAIAPRASLLLPSGSVSEAIGAGGYGMQFNFPLSIKLNSRFVAHTNAGATFIPSGRGENNLKVKTKGYNLGQSVVWLAAPRFNVLVEGIYTRDKIKTSDGASEIESELLINPGVRWAYNFRSGLQIVPGIAVPVGIGASHGTRGIFFYLSFEHPFGNRK